MKFERGKLLAGPAEIGWRLGFGDGKGEIKYLADGDMPEFTPAPDGGVWRNEKGLAVTVKWQEKEGLFQGTISFSGNTPGTPVEEIHFPCAAMDFDEKTKLLTPNSQGRIIDLAAEWREEKFIAGRYRAFRFTAALFGGRGLYFDCRDPECHNKSYKWDWESGKLLFSHIHYCPLDGRTQDALPYPCSVANFEGDWFEAAQIYRPWARRQRWYVNAA